MRWCSKAASTPKNSEKKVELAFRRVTDHPLLNRRTYHLPQRGHDHRLRPTHLVRSLGRQASPNPQTIRSLKQFSQERAQIHRNESNRLALKRS